MPLELTNTTFEHIARCLWYRKHCLPPPTRSLDVGCSYFQLLDSVDGDAGRDLVFRHEGHGCVGLDKNRDILELAKRNRPLDQALYCDIGVDRFPVEDDSFENVLVGEIIEHLPLEQWPHLLNECFRVARYQILVSAPGHHPEEDMIFPPSANPDAHHFEPSRDTFQREVARILGDRARRIEHDYMLDWVAKRLPDELDFNFMLCRIYKREIAFV